MHIHPYERLWIRISAVLLVVFGLAVAVSSLALGIEIPGVEGRGGPAGAPAQALAGGVRELGPLRYEVDLVARMWGYEPATIRLPEGSRVTFRVQSADVIHGLKIMGTSVSLMILPGQVGRATYTFDEPGEYLFVCHEYCGMGHHVMSGKILVEER